MRLTSRSEMRPSPFSGATVMTRSPRSSGVQQSSRVSPPSPPSSVSLPSQAVRQKSAPSTGSMSASSSSAALRQISTAQIRDGVLREHGLHGLFRGQVAERDVIIADLQQRVEELGGEVAAAKEALGNSRGSDAPAQSNLWQTAFAELRDNLDSQRQQMQFMQRIIMDQNISLAAVHEKIMDQNIETKQVLAQNKELKACLVEFQTCVAQLSQAPTCREVLAQSSDVLQRLPSAKLEDVVICSTPVKARTRVGGTDVSTPIAPDAADSIEAEFTAVDQDSPKSVKKKAAAKAEFKAGDEAACNIEVTVADRVASSPKRSGRLMARDLIDQRLEEYLASRPDFQIDIDKVKPGWYVFGDPVSKKLYLKVAGDHVVCRVGGGHKELFAYLDEYWHTLKGRCEPKAQTSWSWNTKPPAS